MKSEKITAKGTEVTIIARYKNPHEPKDVVKNWMRSKKHY